MHDKKRREIIHVDEAQAAYIGTRLDLRCQLCELEYREIDY